MNDFKNDLDMELHKCYLLITQIYLPICLANCSIVNLFAISSALVGIFIPILQVNLSGGEATRI